MTWGPLSFSSDHTHDPTTQVTPSTPGSGEGQDFQTDVHPKLSVTRYEPCTLCYTITRIMLMEV